MQGGGEGGGGEGAGEFAVPPVEVGDAEVLVAVDPGPCTGGGFGGPGGFGVGEGGDGALQEEFRGEGGVGDFGGTAGWGGVTAGGGKDHLWFVKYYVGWVKSV